jgi:hypothetical protein
MTVYLKELAMINVLKDKMQISRNYKRSSYKELVLPHSLFA